MEISAPLMIYAYWAISIVIGFAFFKDDILNFNKDFDTRRKILLLCSVVILAINAWVYSHSTSDGGRPLNIPTVIVFSIGNGIAETFMFYACFQLGKTLAGKVTENPWVLFIAGFICFMIYSGIVHGLFWLQILPEHVVQTSPYKPLFMPVQLLIASSWALNFFWYRDIRTVIFLHALVDLTMACSVKFSMFN
ncbi:MAG: hypothetical protein HGB20_01470 [Chlorobiaceae bacterium]|nr:hypothetical protein [Chlorobiaceae bacterium]